MISRKLRIVNGSVLGVPQACDQQLYTFIRKIVNDVRKNFKEFVGRLIMKRLAVICYIEYLFLF